MRRMGLTFLILVLIGVPALHAQELPAPDAMVADVVRMEADSNTRRREVLEAILDERGISHTLETFPIASRFQYPRTMGGNLVVTLGEGAEDIVVGAHMDAVWLPDGSLSRGAVDNAASAIILTRLASSLSGRDLRHRFRIVFFDAEEIGLVGSQSYVAAHAADSIAAAVNLDVNGYGDTLFWGPTSATGNAPVHSAVAAVCDGADFDCIEFPRYPQSDYISFQNAGIPNVSLSVLPAVEAEQLRVAMNGTQAEIAALGGPPSILALIHTPADRSDRIDADGMTITYRALLALVEKLDAME